MWHSRSGDHVLERRAEPLLFAHAPDERRIEMPRERVRRRIHATSRNAGTGSRFPFSSSGSTGSTVTASRTSDSVSAPIRISPGGAACSSRAATLTASPVTSVSPSPATTSPVFTPVRKKCDRELLAERRQPLADLGHRAHRPQRIVLVRDRDAEHRHRRVSDELLHRAAMALDDQPDLLEVATHRSSHRLGIEPLAERRRAGHVAEDDRHRLAYLPRRGDRGERSPATATEPEPVGALLATGGARGHAPSISAIAVCMRGWRREQTDRATRVCAREGISGVGRADPGFKERGVRISASRDSRRRFGVRRDRRCLRRPG